MDTDKITLTIRRFTGKKREEWPAEWKLKFQAVLEGADLLDTFLLSSEEPTVADADTAEDKVGALTEALREEVEVETSAGTPPSNRSRPFKLGVTHAIRKVTRQMNVQSSSHYKANQATKQDGTMAY